MVSGLPSDVPTAHTSLVATAATANNWLFVPWSGELTICQLAPSKWMVKVCEWLFVSIELPTAQMSLDETGSIP
jgi:hypothetical protein